MYNLCPAQRVEQGQGCAGLLQFRIAQSSNFNSKVADGNLITEVLKREYTLILESLKDTHTEIALSCYKPINTLPRK